MVEKRILAMALKPPFLVQLHSCFQTMVSPRNRFQGINSASLCSLAGRYDNPSPTRFLAPIVGLKIPAQCCESGYGGWPPGSESFLLYLSKMQRNCRKKFNILYYLLFSTYLAKNVHKKVKVGSGSGYSGIHN
jgi:hypothetical protein